LYSEKAHPAKIFKRSLANEKDVMAVGILPANRLMNNHTGGMWHPF
jgi:hypothetical protein